MMGICKFTMMARLPCDYMKEKLVLKSSTDHAGEVAFMEVLQPGSPVASGSSYEAMESVTATSDVNSPISGKVVEVNSKLTESPDLVTPYSSLLYAKLTIEGMKMVAEYKAQKEKNDERVILAKKLLSLKVKAT
ncbi:hypothetical protein RHSIM_Rhsim11G0010000 [Rhododendron simsii]|uniref:Lipoyl-binding domain-containing protein n=1 Tax=Rhododendron simsii TaxID=118357 RepID=A0A834L8R7_RHOSS|nr:hypothetical protein RHSIM_Rhsim11G0010000 [Rhododendron simsii]